MCGRVGGDGNAVNRSEVEVFVFAAHLRSCGCDDDDDNGERQLRDSCEMLCGVCVVPHSGRFHEVRAPLARTDCTMHNVHSFSCVIGKYITREKRARFRINSGTLLRASKITSLRFDSSVRKVIFSVTTRADIGVKCTWFIMYGGVDVDERC